MCTLLTISRGFYRANRLDVLRTIRYDAGGNPHGFALELIDRASPLFLQGFDIEKAIKLIENSDFDRLVLHQRFSTTQNVELVDCHGYVGIDGSRWYHNGIIDNPARLRVDSINLIDCISVYDAVHVYKGAYANLIRVSDTGDVSVGRAGNSGRLHRDAKGHNFSTTIIGKIKIPVKPMETFEIAAKKRKRPNDYYYGIEDKFIDPEMDWPAEWINEAKSEYLDMYREALKE